MNSAPVCVEPVKDKKGLKEFLRFPWSVYPKSSPWVPPLLSDLEELFDPARGHPFQQHAEMQLFVARRDGTPVGRIAAIDNQAHTDVYHDGVGFFGFFECLDDHEAAAALFAAAEGWLSQRGLTSMRGPMNPSINDSVGLLLDDFAGRPVIEMPYNPPYYPELFARCGVQQIKTLYAYVARRDVNNPTEKQVRLGEAVRKRYKIVLRNARVKDAENEAAILEKIYREAWSELWGAVPLTKEEAVYLTKKLTSLADERMVLIASIDDEPVGFAMAIPDWNQVLRHLNGRLTPFNALKALWYRRKMDGLRTMALGVMADHRRKGIEALMTLEMFKRALAAGYQYMEVSWVLEENTQAINVLTKLGLPRYRSYGLYERALAGS
ncbi:MAG: GNAT family N-acetyltransferase [Dehalococcoidia bacterium]